MDALLDSSQTPAGPSSPAALRTAWWALGTCHIPWAQAHKPLSAGLKGHVSHEKQVFMQTASSPKHIWGMQYFPRKGNPEGKLSSVTSRPQPLSQPGSEASTASVPCYPRASLALPEAAPNANVFVLTGWQDENKAAVKEKLLLLGGSLSLSTVSKHFTKKSCAVAEVGSWFITT